MSWPLRLHEPRVATPRRGSRARRHDAPRSVLWRHELALAPLLLLFLALAVWFPEHPSDERNYLELAHNLTQGEYTGLGWRPASPYPSPDPAEPDLWFGPGLPLAIAPLVAAELPVGVVRLASPVFLFLAVLLFARLLRLYVGRRAALLGAYGLGSYFPFYVLLSNLHSEPLAILLIVAMLYCLARYVRGGSLGFGLLGGLSAAGVALTRVAFGWVVAAMLVVFLCAWLLARRPALGRIAFVYSVALALCLPWLVFTYSETGRVFLWGNSGSLSLYWMSSPHRQDLGDWRGGAYEIVVSDPRLSHHREFFEELAPLDPDEQNRRLERAALDNIRGDPGKFVKNVAANGSRMWFDMPFSDKPQMLSTLYYLVPNSLILWLLVICSILLARRRSRIPPEAFAFAAFATLAFGLHAVLAAYPRMLMPIIPIGLWIVVYTVGTTLRPTAEEPRRPAAGELPP